VDLVPTGDRHRQWDRWWIEEFFIRWPTHGQVEQRIVEHATGDAVVGLVVHEHPTAIRPAITQGGLRLAQTQIGEQDLAGAVFGCSPVHGHNLGQQTSAGNSCKVLAAR
jgi:hypothetical protein